MTDIIAFQNINKSYPVSLHTWVLHNLNLIIYEGEFFCLVGPSGCGKSTLLKLIIGLELPNSGKIIKPDNIGMVFQSGALMPWLNAWENVEFGLKMSNMEKSEIQEKVNKYLKLVNMTDYKNKYPRELSGGQRQRIGIARALAIEPKLLLLDEPFSALDPLTTEELHHDLIKIWQETHITIMMVSHLLEEAVILSDRIGVMANGTIYQIIDVNLPRPRVADDITVEKEVKKIRDILEEII